MKNLVLLVLVLFVSVSAYATLGGLYNVDFEQLDGEGTFKAPMVGPGPDGGVGSAGDIWNIFEVSEGGTAALISLNLVDSTGAASGVTLNFTGADGSGLLGAYGHAPDAINNLVGEYLFLGGQNNTYTADFSITGLTGGGIYDLYLWTGGPAFGSYAGNGMTSDIDVDLDGDGVLDGAGPILEQAAPTVISGIVADAGGTILLQNLDNGGLESEWSGFQLIEVPEPATLCLLGLGGLLLRRRR